MESLKKKISLIVPAYNESGNIRRFVAAVSEVLSRLSGYDWKIVFVDDGSVDGSWEVIRAVAREDSRVRGVRLSRNFGKEIALTAGAEAVNGSAAVIFMDADLQHPPELIPELVAKWEQGFQIVTTRRISIEYSRLRKLGARLFYFMLNRFSSLKIEPCSTDYRLLDRDVLNVLKTFEERTRFFR
jgi:dolichol-phosphate mannosyltransferase